MGRLEKGIFWSVPWHPGRERPSNEQGIDLHLLLQGQAQECLLEKSMLDNRKSFLVARISAQVGQGLGRAFTLPLVLDDWTHPNS